jgi:predicted Zn-dependent peptidase
LWGRVIPLQETVDRINRITVDRVKQVAHQIFSSDRLSLAGVGPVEQLPDYGTITDYLKN